MVNLGVCTIISGKRITCFAFNIKFWNFYWIQGWLQGFRQISANEGPFRYDENVLYFTPKAFHSQVIQFLSYNFFFNKDKLFISKVITHSESYNIQEEIWKQIISISGIKNKLGMKFGQLVEYNRRFQKNHSEKRTEKLVTRALFCVF